jgi:hypothetical protein
MATEHHIICGGIAAQNIGSDADKLRLNLWDGRRGCNVRLKIEALHKQLYKNIPSQFHDLLEIATYVYCADQAFTRGARDVQTLGDNWRRRMHFHIPVRKPAVWNDAKIKKVLQDTLGFLSDDFYEFTFEAATDAPPLQNYFDFEKGAAPNQKPEQVMMFSGGLDSLAGAVEEIVRKKIKVALVNHQSTPKFKRKYDELIGRLEEKAGDIKPIQLRVEINKEKGLGKDYSQRARSFLYASLGATVAMMLDLRKLCFYENGIVSLNLPVCAQVVGGRATRTTHPRVLCGLQELLSLLAGEKFTVENPFLWLTKGEVVKKILDNDCGSLIASSRSCAHTWETTNEHTHCGVCSQCIDRRFGIIAAKADEFDPLAQYKLDVFRESRPKDADKIMGAAYLEKAIQCKALTDVGEFIINNPEVTRVLGHVEGNRGSAAQRILDLHKRHAKEVTDAIQKLIRDNTQAIMERSLPPDSLLRTAIESQSPLTMPAIEKVVEKIVPASEISGNILRKELRGWMLVFDGETRLLPDDKGVYYVAYLLKNPPDEPIHASELASKAFGDAVIEGQRNLSADDKNTFEAMKKSRREYLAASGDPNASELERTEAEEKLKEIEDWSKKHFRGTEASEQKQARAIRAAMRRLLESLEKATGEHGEADDVLRSFGEHLDRYLVKPSAVGSTSRKARVASGMAGKFHYLPPKDVKWSG